LLQQVQAAGFLQGWTEQAARSAVDRVWGARLPEQAENRIKAELMLASLDQQRVWHSDVKFQGDPGQAYTDALSGWARVCRGLFDPVRIDIDPDGEIRFEAHGYTYRFTPLAGHYLDLGLLNVVNSSLHGPCRLQICDGLGMPNLVVLLTPEEKAMLSQERGWTFVDAGTVSGSMFGYLGDYWAQGMEEPAWLIFQDSRFCGSPTAGWDTEGMHRIEPEAQMTVFRTNGSVLWQGTLGRRRGGFWSWLLPNDSDWFPEGMGPDAWHSMFHHDPPRRAAYQKPLNA
jgi:hypothetical protein